MAGQAANDLYSQNPFAVWPNGPELKSLYHDGSFEEILLALRAQQIAGGRIAEADVLDIKEVYLDSFAKKCYGWLLDFEGFAT